MEDAHALDSPECTSRPRIASKARSVSACKKLSAMRPPAEAVLGGETHRHVSLVVPIRKTDMKKTSRAGPPLEYTGVHTY
jgi:hypothetical protein